MVMLQNRLNKFKKHYIGKKPVTIEKITIKQWKQLFGTIETLPQLILDVMSASEDEKSAYFIVALERSFDEVVDIVSVLTGIESEHIEENASIDQLIAYFTEIAKVNDFSGVIKNVKSVLALGMPSQQPTAASEDAQSQN